MIEIKRKKGEQKQATKYAHTQSPVLTLRHENHPVNKTRFLVNFDVCVRACVNVYEYVYDTQHARTKVDITLTTATTTGNTMILNTLNADNKHIDHKKNKNTV